MKGFLKSVISTAVGVIVGVLVAMILLPILIFSLVSEYQSGGSVDIERDSMLHIRLSGQLIDHENPLNFNLFGDRSVFVEEKLIGLFELQQAIERAESDDRIRGIFLEFGRFSSGWANALSLKRSLDKFSSSKKPIFVYSDHYDEVSYLIASASTHILMEPSGNFEWNGLSMSTPFFKELLGKLELEPRVFRVGKFKSAIEPFIRSEMSDENRRQSRQLIDELWGVFRTEVVKRLGKDPSEVDQIAEGLEVTNAREAEARGLISRAVFRDEVIQEIKSVLGTEGKALSLVKPSQLVGDSIFTTISRDRNRGRTGKSKRVAVVFAEGEIHSGAGRPDSIGVDSLRKTIEGVRKNDDVGALVLRINSPGGDALASDVIWRELMITDKKIPVVISMGNVAASGGYYIASAGRYILAEPTTITGSIGVFGLMFNTEKFFNKKVGVAFDSVSTHSHAEIGSSTREMTQFEEKKIQSEVERVYGRFLDVVQEGRGYKSRSDLEGIAEGRVWSGIRAKELGLVDELGGLDLAIEKAIQLAKLSGSVEVEVYPKEGDSIRQLLDRFMDESMRLKSIMSFLENHRLSFFTWVLRHALNREFGGSGRADWGQTYDGAPTSFLAEHHPLAETWRPSSIGVTRGLLGDKGEAVLTRMVFDLHVH